jgi:hypothetical protein
VSWSSHIVLNPSGSALLGHLTPDANDTHGGLTELLTARV